MLKHEKKLPALPEAALDQNNASLPIGKKDMLHSGDQAIGKMVPHGKAEIPNITNEKVSNFSIINA